LKYILFSILLIGLISCEESIPKPDYSEYDIVTQGDEDISEQDEKKQDEDNTPDTAPDEAEKDQDNIDDETPDQDTVVEEEKPYKDYQIDFYTGTSTSSSFKLKYSINKSYKTTKGLNYKLKYSFGNIKLK